MGIFYDDPRQEPTPRIWGIGVFDNDAGVRARDCYLDYLLNGRSDSEATRMTIELRNIDAYDIDCKILFWTALAEIKWQIGCLDSGIMKTAIDCIKVNDCRLYEKSMRNRREKLLDELVHKYKYDAPIFPIEGDELIKFCRKIWGDKFDLHVN